MNNIPVSTSSNSYLFLNYLEQLPPATLNRLWVDTRTALAVYRQLNHVAQYIIQRLLLSLEATPFEELRSWHPPQFKSTQNPALLSLKHLQILQGRSGEVWLNDEFRMSLIRAFSGDLEVSASERENVTGLGEEQWESLLYMLVTETNDPGRRQGHLMEVLVGADLISTDLAITNRGFQFLLTERYVQLWTLIIQYFLMIETSGMDVVSCIISICRLSLMPIGSMVTAILPAIAIDFLADLGLIKASTRWKKEYVATSLVEQLAAIQSQSTNAGYIVIETNYKIYAYTNSPLQIAILGLFVRLKDRFSNMVQGQLTGPSVQAAFSRGITALQIIAYLNQNIHPTMRKAGQGLSAVIEDQIYLWERDRNRLKYVDGYLYQGFMQDEAFNRTVGEAQRLEAVQYINYQKRLLVVQESAHPSIKAFIKSEIQ